MMVTFGGRLEMRRVDAKPILAPMVQIETVRNRPDHQFISNPIRVSALPLVEKAPAPALPDARKERPAFIITASINLLHKSVNWSLHG